MPNANAVNPTDTFQTWRIETNNLINVVNLPLNGNPPVVQDRAQAWDITGSSAAHTGLTISANTAADGTIDVAAGEALLRTSAAPTAVITNCQLTATSAMALTNSSNNYIYADFNGGNPTISSTTVKSTVNGLDTALIGVVYREGTSVDILQVAGSVGDYERRLSQKNFDEETKRTAGANITKANLNLLIEAGEFYKGLIKYTTSAIDTSGADTFDYYYNNGTQTVINQSALDNTQYDNNGTLTALTASYYTANWLYLKLTNGDARLTVLYGTGEGATIDAAKAFAAPAAPVSLDELGVYIGRAIVQQGNGIIVEIEKVEQVRLVPDNVHVHGNLGLLETITDAFKTADRTKLNGIATGATANSSDATLLNTDNHTDGIINKVYTATEQTKLSNIELSATADQTPAEILTALLTVDGAGSGLDADALDGLNPASAGTSNTIAQRDVTGNLTANEFVSTNGATTTASPSNLFVETGSDGVIRKQPQANFLTNLSLRQHHVAGTWSGAQSFDMTAAVLTDAATVLWDGPTQQVAEVVLNGTRVIANITNPVDGCFYTIRCLSNAAGITTSWGTQYKFPGGTVPTASPSGFWDIYTFLYQASSTILLCVGMSQNISNV